MHWSFEGFQVKEEFFVVSFVCSPECGSLFQHFLHVFSNIRHSAGNLIN